MQLDIVWLQFIAVTAVIVFAGIKITRYADFIAAHTKLGRLWVGVILLAIATSLPELMNGISASLQSLPDIAVGNIFGACLLNLLQIAIIDFYYKPAPVLTSADKGHLLSSGFGIFFFFIIGYSLFAESIGFSLSFLTIGLYTPLLFFIYFVAIRFIYVFQKRKISEEIKEIAKPYKISLYHAYLRFAIYALIIIFAGIFLPTIGARLATLTGWNQSFVGTLFLGLSTSLPELVVSISAIRIGALDLALGNILGSNLINLTIIGIDDLFFTSGSILLAASAINMLSVLAAVGMYSTVVISIIYESKVKKLRFTGTALTLLAIYVLNALFIFRA
ncbi:MAG: sodium:calcium antiporter [Actinobacteria bacterium]|nr:MAG: sodium:calcium antiporter [Actinomycetota bacterium]